MTESGSRITGRVIFGIVVIALGIVFLLDELDFVDAEDVLGYWPALTFGWGAMLMTGLCCRRNLPAGLLVSFFSGWLLLLRLDVVRRDPWDLWPLVLIVLGATMVFTALRRPPTVAALEGGAATLRAFALWSGSERKIVTEDFRGGEVTAIMGGHEIDLRPAKMPGGTAVIDLFVWWGGVELQVPTDWKVTNEALALLGGVTDTTRAPEGEIKGHLVVRGLVVMGGVEMRN